MILWKTLLMYWASTFLRGVIWWSVWLVFWSWSDGGRMLLQVQDSMDASSHWVTLSQSCLLISANSSVQRWCFLASLWMTLAPSHLIIWFSLSLRLVRAWRFVAFLVRLHFYQPCLYFSVSHLHSFSFSFCRVLKIFPFSPMYNVLHDWRSISNILLH